MSALLSGKTSSDMSTHATSQSNPLQEQLETILGKLKADPSSITLDEARLLSENLTTSDERSGSSYAQAPHRSLLTAAKDLHVAVDDSPDEVTTEVLRTTQSIVSKMQKILGPINVPNPEVEAELQKEITKIEPKIAQGTVTKAEADRLHSLESRAHGHTEKGGITAAAQSVVAKRERQLSLSDSSGAFGSSNSEQSRPNDGSFTSHEQQSQHDREENLLQAKDSVKAKIEEGTVTKAEAAKLQSLESRAHGGAMKGGIAATAQSTAAKHDVNASDATPPTNGKNTLSPQEQSHSDKEENIHQAEVAIKPKIEEGTVTAAEANKLNSREMRAHGHIEKGGTAATAQSVVSKERQRTLSDISNSANPSDTDAGQRKEQTQVDKELKKDEGSLGDVSKAENEAH